MSKSIKLIEHATRQGAYDMPYTEAIVEMPDGKHVYIVQGYGGESSLDGGQYRWRHGVAVQVRVVDTIDSLHENDHMVPVNPMERMMYGDDPKRPLLEWSASKMESVARAAKLMR